MRWLRRRRAQEDRSAAERLDAAEREVEISRQRLAETHELVVKPLRRYAEHNHFADIIAASLADGRRGGSGG